MREALKERRILIKNAPHLVHSKPFILPCYKKGEREFYTIGLGIYSAMTYGGYNIGHTSSLSREDTLMRLPGVKPEGLMGACSSSTASSTTRVLTLRSFARPTNTAPYRSTTCPSLASPVKAA